MLDRFLSVTIKFVFRRYAVFSWIFSVVTLIVERGNEPLVIWRHDARSENGAVVTGAVVDLRDRVGLHEVLRCVVHMLNHAGIVIQRRIAILGPAAELKLVADCRTSGGHVLAESYVDLIKDGVVEVQLVRPDARFFKRINAKCD